MILKAGKGVERELIQMADINWSDLSENQLHNTCQDPSNKLLTQ